MIEENIWNELVKCLLAAGEMYIKTYPSIFNSYTGRFYGSDYFTRFLMKEVNKNEILRSIFTDVSSNAKGFDFIIDLGGESKKISFKLQKSTHIIQHTTKRKNKDGTASTKLNKPGIIQLKNPHSSAEDDNTIKSKFKPSSLKSEFDFLIAFQTQDKKKNQYAAVGVISIDNLISKCLLDEKVCFKKTSDQIHLRIWNDAWDRLHIENKFFNLEEVNDDIMKQRNRIWNKSIVDWFDNYYRTIKAKESI